MRQFWSSTANLSDLRNIAGVGFKRTNVDNTEFQQQHLKLSRNLWTQLPSLEDIVLCILPLRRAMLRRLSFSLPFLFYLPNSRLAFETYLEEDT